MSHLSAENRPPVRVAFQTFGCRSNYADTVDLQAALVEHGAIPCNFEADADVYLVNTCTVTNEADREAFKTLKKLRSRAPQSRIVVTGCLAEVGEGKLLESGYVDAVVGPGRKPEILNAILGSDPSDLAEAFMQEQAEVVTFESRRRVKKSLPDRHSISLLDSISPELGGPDMPLGEVRNRARYHLRVQEGCDNNCTFCIIPFTRGRLSSRPVSLIVEDLKHLYNVGYREVVLTGTHLGGWGEDCGSSLTELMKTLEGESPIRRLRLSSIDPNDVTPEMIEIFAKSNVFCSHLHICVQAFSDKLLKLMNRRYRLSEVFAILEELVSRVPNIGLGSDIIVGFPGERRQDEEQARELFLELPFSYLHVFPYSERAGTAATRLPGSIPIVERRRRARIWRDAAESKRQEFLEKLIGHQLEIVIEGTKDGRYFGTSREFATVELEANGAAIARGTCVNVNATGLSNESGRLVCQLLNQENFA